MSKNALKLDTRTLENVSLCYLTVFLSLGGGELENQRLLKNLLPPGPQIFLINFLDSVLYQHLLAKPL